MTFMILEDPTVFVNPPEMSKLTQFLFAPQNSLSQVVQKMRTFLEFQYMC